MPTDNQANNNRIAKNTLLLYFRMLLIMGVSLYTSRVVLKALGFDDFGIYNVVGGIVLMFQMLSGSLSTAISRFFTVELGKGNYEVLRKIFSTSLCIQFFLIAIIVLLMETIGLWYLYNKMIIPEPRLSAAFWVLQFSVVTFSINLLSIPYTAVIIAYERMSAFAYISIIEVLFKLVVAWAIYYNPFDRLVFYAFLLMIVSASVRIVYGIYCNKNFEESKCKLELDCSLLKEMFGLAGWNFLGNSANLLNTQGINMVLNSFFGVVVNAAVGIVSQVNNVINQFAFNFSMALNPQITKSFSIGNYDYCYRLVSYGAKYCFLLLLCIAIPLIFEAEQILNLWLTDYPECTLVFIKWSILGAVVATIGNSLYTLMMAQGDIKDYQIYISLFGCLPFVLSWIVFCLGGSSEWAFILYFIIYYLLIFLRLYFARMKTNIPVGLYLREVVLKTHIVGVLSVIFPFGVVYFFQPSFGRIILTLLMSIISVVIFSLFFALNKDERLAIKRYFIKH